MPFPIFILVVVAAGIIVRIPAVRRSRWAVITISALLVLVITVDMAQPPTLLLTMWPLLVVLWTSIAWAIAVEFAHQDFLEVALRNGLDGLPSRQMMTTLPGLLVTLPISALMALAAGFTIPVGMEVANAAIGINSNPSTIESMSIMAPLAVFMIGTMALAVGIAKSRDPWYLTKIGLARAAVARGERRTELLEGLIANAPRV